MKLKYELGNEPVLEIYASNISEKFVRKSVEDYIFSKAGCLKSFTLFKKRYTLHGKMLKTPIFRNTNEQMLLIAT